MKRLLTLTVLVAAGALLLQWRELREAYEEQEELKADLMLCQDAQFALVEERDRWRDLADQQHQALVHLSGQAEAAALEVWSDGGWWLFKDGWHAPRGPFSTSEEAASEAESTAEQYPGEVVHLLGSTSSVLVAAPEPIWDYGPSDSELNN